MVPTFSPTQLERNCRCNIIQCIYTCTCIYILYIVCDMIFIGYESLSKGKSMSSSCASSSIIPIPPDSAQASQPMPMALRCDPVCSTSTDNTYFPINSQAMNFPTHMDTLLAATEAFSHGNQEAPTLTTLLPCSEYHQDTITSTASAWNSNQPEELSMQCSLQEETSNAEPSLYEKMRSIETANAEQGSLRTVTRKRKRYTQSSILRLQHEVLSLEKKKLQLEVECMRKWSTCLSIWEKQMKNQLIESVKLFD